MQRCYLSQKDCEERIVRERNGEVVVKGGLIGERKAGEYP